MRAVPLALLLAACAEAPQPVVPDDGGPDFLPKMGEVTGTLGGEPVAWATYDLPFVGVEASASVENSDGLYRFQLTGYKPGHPEILLGNLEVTGTFAGGPKTGNLKSVKISTGESETWIASQPTLVVERITTPEGSGYGSASGRITATFCPPNPAMGAPCRLFEARFDTKVQFNG